MAKTSIRLGNDQLALELLPIGASLHRFEVPAGDGEWCNLVVSREDPTSPTADYLGATVGRFANRIGGARFELDGIEHRLDANENGNQLHGGPTGFSQLSWQVESRSDTAVIFVLVSPDGDNGFPGKVRASAEYSLIPGGAQVIYRATTDAPTVVNLTTHPYFILDDADILDHRLTVRADAYTPVAEGLIPTGEIRPVDGTALDFRQGRLLAEALGEARSDGTALAGGLDHNFVIGGTGLREQVRVEGPTGIVLSVLSDAPGVQIYSGEGIGRRGLAVEPQNFPDAPNHPGFPSAVLRPGEEYHRTIQWLVQLP